jgi:thiosulfate dehydrogenase
MVKFILGMIAGIVLLIGGVLLYLVSGYAPVTATDPPFPFEERIAMKALHAKADREMPKTTPIAADENNLAAGVRVYRENCAACHGLPNQPEPIIAKGMFPHAPQLLMKDEMVADDPAGETFWKAKNGIRLTGMPGFGGSLSNDQLWQVSLLLAEADKLPPSVQQALAAPAPPPAAPAAQPSGNKPM